MENLMRNAQIYFSEKYKNATLVSAVITYPSEHIEDLQVGALSLLDTHSGIRNRALVIKDLGNNVELEHIAKSIDEIFNNCDGDLLLHFSNEQNLVAHAIESSSMAIAPVLAVYTNRLTAPTASILKTFENRSQKVRIHSEAKMFLSVFVSYGGPDEKIAAELNKKIRAAGVTTWFFMDDAMPGDKLHRMMHNGVNQQDRVLLLCSQNSLSRKGVLNEIERVLEREAKEGGDSILIPVTLDDYVFTDWAPARPDLAEQIRSRVIQKLVLEDGNISDIQIQKILKALGR